MKRGEEKKRSKEARRSPGTGLLARTRLQAGGDAEEDSALLCGRGLARAGRPLTRLAKTDVASPGSGPWRELGESRHLRGVTSQRRGEAEPPNPVEKELAVARAPGLFK